MCARCYSHYTPPKPLRQSRVRLASATPTEGTVGVEKIDEDTEQCPVHGILPPLERDDTVTEEDQTKLQAGNFQDISAVINTEKIQHSEHEQTEKVSEASRKIRDSIEFTSQTCTARQNFNLYEMTDLDEDLLSEALIQELKAIASGKFELGGDPVLVSAQVSELSRVKSTRINLLSLGAYSVKDEVGALDAQSNIATNEFNSVHQTSLILHSELGSKQCATNTKAEANQKASGAYGSELAYSTSQCHK